MKRRLSSSSKKAILASLIPDPQSGPKLDDAEDIGLAQLPAPSGAALPPGGRLNTTSDPSSTSSAAQKHAAKKFTKVLHTRGWTSSIDSHRLSSVILKHQLTPVQVLVLENRGQAFVEFPNEDDARTFLDLCRQELVVCDDHAVQAFHSGLSEVVHKKKTPTGPGKVVHVTITKCYDGYWPLTLAEFIQVFRNYGANVLRIIAFRQNLLVEFESREAAQEAMSLMNERYIFCRDTVAHDCVYQLGVCKMLMQYSPLPELSIKADNEKMADLTRESSPYRRMSTNSQSTSISSVSSLTAGPAFQVWSNPQLAVQHHASLSSAAQVAAAAVQRGGSPIAVPQYLPPQLPQGYQPMGAPPTFDQFRRASWSALQGQDLGTERPFEAALPPAALASYISSIANGYNGMVAAPHSQPGAFHYPPAMGMFNNMPHAPAPMQGNSVGVSGGARAPMPRVMEVQGLHLNCSSVDALQNIFGFYGDVMRVKTIELRNSLLVRAFIVFRTPVGVDMSLRMLPGLVLFGHPVTCVPSMVTPEQLADNAAVEHLLRPGESVLGDMTWPERFQGHRYLFSNSKNKKHICPPNSELHLSSIHANCPESAVRTLFGYFGKVVNFRWMKDRSMAFVQLENSDQAARALMGLHSTSPWGIKPLRIAFSESVVTPHRMGM